MIMKKAVIVFAILCLGSSSLTAYASDDTEIIYATPDDILPDSILDKGHDIILDEVTVKGATMITKADRKLLIPTSEQIKNAQTGIQVLKNMQIPGIIINPLDNSLALASNGKLTLLLNGRPVTANDIKGIEPQYIIRVEYHDNPSLRFGDSEAVLDFIVKQPTTGGNLMLALNQSVNRGWAEDYVTIKVNHKKSEFGASYWFSPRWNFKVWRNNDETYKYPNGTTYHKTETGVPAQFCQFQQSGNIFYNFLESDKMMFSAQATLGALRNPMFNYHGILSNSQTNESSEVIDNNSEYNLAPTLDLYYQYNLPKSQLLMFNVVGGYKKSSSSRNYIETPIDDISSTSSDILTEITGNSYSIVAEGDYEKLWNSSRLTTGAKYIHTWNNSTYTLSNTRTKMRQSETYVFGEWWKKLNDKFDMTLGIGISDYCFHQDGGASSSSIIFRPKLSFRYIVNKQSNIRFELYNYGNSPSIAQLNNVRQEIDQIQVQIGNPNLKAFQTYRLNLSYEYAKGIFYGKLRARYWGHSNPIMDEKYWENDKIVNTFNNQKNLHELNFDIHAKIQVIPDWLSVSGSLGWHRYISHGNSYTHCYNNWFYNASLQITHWGFTLDAMMRNNYNTFWGENLIGNENIQWITLSYNYKNMNFGANIINPFIKNYNIPSENRNEYAGYKREMKTHGVEQLIAISFNYNFSWGRKHKSTEKRINNSSATESIKAAGK
ncbi:MAG: outer membrane beta-barrel protein [Muribaculaceae bacterium]